MFIILSRLLSPRDLGLDIYYKIIFMIVYIPTLVSVKFKEVRNKFIILETELDPSRNNSNVGEISENLQPHRKSVYALNFSSYTPLAVRPESDP